MFIVTLKYVFFNFIYLFDIILDSFKEDIFVLQLFSKSLLKILKPLFDIYFIIIKKILSKLLMQKNQALFYWHCLSHYFQTLLNALCSLQKLLARLNMFTIFLFVCATVLNILCIRNINSNTIMFACTHMFIRI